MAHILSTGVIKRVLTKQPSLSANFSSTTNLLKDINTVTIVGAGLMGSGIVQVAAQANCKVTMVDTSDAAIANGQSIIASSLKRVARKKFAEDEQQQKQFIDKVLANITTSTQAEKAVHDADLVVEAIVENIDIKRKLFSTLDKVAPKHSIFCSNTSSLPITAIAESTSPERQQQFAGLHFFNPVPAMKLVEIVRTDTVSDEVFQSLQDFTTKVGKTPVSCKDTPGFIVNRLLVPYMFEAFRVLDRKEASIKDIDTAMKLGAGMPMGPFELADFVGLDTMKFIVDGWAKEGKIEPALVQPSKSLDDLVKEGHLGRKSGKGFYDYKK
ncbi:3-hydroxyacyl-CoA dehydrogenase [Halteromyces radiatus]|uniref:3-hydroxyacyl-CoA dehydrogenase n=1 Tax=Halteromyces radiatus TaxID=101107 RepID=UPI00221E715C|nr:3-hydroxyacyl-CoA dehydrogenase [Halteromyces radiatus]KAI8086698.1 3-hydroxyacyl-CoA dehydrogenase [Halteromyces radiatus]